MSEQAGSHRQESHILRVCRQRMTPVALRSGTPAQIAARIKELHLSPPPGDCGNTNQGQHRQPYQDTSLPEWLDAISVTFFNLEHLYLGESDNPSRHGGQNSRNNVYSVSPNEDENSNNNNETETRERGQSRLGQFYSDSKRVNDNHDKKHKNAIKKRKARRLRRLYVMYRLPNLKTIDGTPVTSTERRLARPNDPNGQRVKMADWIDSSSVKKCVKGRDEKSIGCLNEDYSCDDSPKQVGDLTTSINHSHLPRQNTVTGEAQLYTPDNSVLRDKMSVTNRSHDITGIATSKRSNVSYQCQPPQKPKRTDDSTFERKHVHLLRQGRDDSVNSAYDDEKTAQSGRADDDSVEVGICGTVHLACGEPDMGTGGKTSKAAKLEVKMEKGPNKRRQDCESTPFVCEEKKEEKYPPLGDSNEPANNSDDDYDYTSVVSSDAACQWRVACGALSLPYFLKKDAKNGPHSVAATKCVQNVLRRCSKTSSKQPRVVLGQGGVMCDKNTVTVGDVEIIAESCALGGIQTRISPPGAIRSTNVVLLASNQNPSDKASGTLSPPQSPNKRLPPSKSLSSPFPMQFRSKPPMTGADVGAATEAPRTRCSSTGREGKHHNSQTVPTPELEQQNSSIILDRYSSTEEGDDVDVVKTETVSGSIPLYRTRSSPSKLAATKSTAISNAASTKKQHRRSHSLVRRKSNLSPLLPVTRKQQQRHSLSDRKNADLPPPTGLQRQSRSLLNKKAHLPPPAPTIEAGRRKMASLLRSSSRGRSRSRSRSRSRWRQKLSARRTSIMDGIDDDDSNDDPHEECDLSEEDRRGDDTNKEGAMTELD